MNAENRILGVRPYLVIAKVSGVEYLVKVNASSAGEAEHIILGKAVCGMHKASVEECQAFDENSPKYFMDVALRANPVSFRELGEIIAKRNAVIEAADELERCEAEVEELKARMAEAKERRDAALRALEEVA